MILISLNYLEIDSLRTNYNIKSLIIILFIFNLKLIRKFSSLFIYSLIINKDTLDKRL